MEINETKRIIWIDNAKAIAIILVIIGHISGVGILGTFIYSFHMPLFFFLSGLCYKNAKIVKKTVRLIYIYCLACLIYTFSWNVIINHQMLCLKEEIYYLIYGSYIEGNPASILWFLLTLAFTMLLFYAIDKYILKWGKKQINVLVVIIILLLGMIISDLKVIFPFRFQTVLVALPFFAFGHFYWKLEKYERNRFLFLIPLTILYIIVSLLNGRVDMESNNYNNYILFIIVAIGGIVLTIFFSKRIHVKFFAIIGKYTLLIYLLHIYLVMMIKYVLSFLMRNELLIKLSSFLITYFVIGLLIYLKESCITKRLLRNLNYKNTEV